jgi:phosphate starvation-inducible PhoH-like protein
MPPTLAPKPASAPLTLEFADNALLPLLFGEHDRHLVRIEQQLNVRLVCRGNRVAIAGARGDAERAAHTLNALYHRLERGEAVGPAEVEATLRLAVPEIAPRLPL